MSINMILNSSLMENGPDSSRYLSEFTVLVTVSIFIVLGPNALVSVLEATVLSQFCTYHLGPITVSAALAQPRMSTPRVQQQTQHWIAQREMICTQAARRPQCAVKWDQNLKPKLAIMHQCTSLTDRRTLTSQHKREMYILHLALKMLTIDGQWTCYLTTCNHPHHTYSLVPSTVLSQNWPYGNHGSKIFYN